MDSTLSNSSRMTNLLSKITKKKTELFKEKSEVEEHPQIKISFKTEKQLQNQIRQIDDIDSIL